jgi:hypothetical protein
MKKIRIGITINITDPNESLFTNGIRQNIIILRELYEKCNNVEKAYIVNVSNIKIEPNSASPLSPYAEHIIHVSEVKEKCDLLVVCHGSLLQEEYDDFHKNGIVIVKQVLGSQMSIFTETVLFQPNSKQFGIYKKNVGKVRSVWISEHFFDNERYFHETLYGCETKIAPYVWSPRFIEEQAQLTKEVTGIDVLYKPSGDTKKRICVFEPNINMVKNAVMPIIIGERFYRQHPELLNKISIFNTNELRTKKDLIDFAKDLDCHINGKLFFENSYNIVHLLSNYTDIVLSHQNGCALNYLYLDAAWLGYPVVHNSHLMKKLAWFYNQNDAVQAVEFLKEVIDNFDKNYKKYLTKSHKFAEKYFITNEENIKGYTKLIEEAMS